MLELHGPSFQDGLPKPHHRYGLLTSSDQLPPSSKTTSLGASSAAEAATSQTGSRTTEAIITNFLSGENGLHKIERIHN